jgi:hypothetical protein
MVWAWILGLLWVLGFGFGFVELLKLICNALKSTTYVCEGPLRFEVVVRFVCLEGNIATNLDPDPQVVCHGFVSPSDPYTLAIARMFCVVKPRRFKWRRSRSGPYDGA